MDAPGQLLGTVLEVLGWRTHHGEIALHCRLADGAVGLIPARWTDLPRLVPAEIALGVLATPAGWRLLAERLSVLSGRHPKRVRASAENRRSCLFRGSVT